MRRKDRQVTDIEDIVSIIQKCNVIHLGMVDEGKPYIVPLNFGLQTEGEHLSFYFHSAGEGRKIDILQKNPFVCFEMENFIDLYRDELVCKWSTQYETVMGEGIVTFIDDAKEKETAFINIVRRSGFKGNINFNPALFTVAKVYRLDVRHITAKRNIKENAQ